MPQVPTAASITLDQTDPAYGDTLTFTTSVPKLQGNEYPMVALFVFQDVNEDGTIDEDQSSPDLVYSWLDQPDATFYTAPPPSGSPPGTPGVYSIWSEKRGGGPAEARADLIAISWKGGKETMRTLATTGEFNIDG